MPGIWDCHCPVIMTAHCSGKVSASLSSTCARDGWPLAGTAPGAQDRRVVWGWLGCDRLRAMPDAQTAIEVLPDLDDRPRQGGTVRVRQELQALSREADGAVIGHRALIAQAADLPRILSGEQRPIGQRTLRRGDGKASIAAVQKPGQEGRGLRLGGDAGEAHLHHQTVLQRAEEPLHPPLGLRQMGAHRWVSSTPAYRPPASATIRACTASGTVCTGLRPRFPCTSPPGPSAWNTASTRRTWRSEMPSSAAAAGRSTSPLSTAVHTIARSCSVRFIVIVSFIPGHNHSTVHAVKVIEQQHARNLGLDRPWRPWYVSSIAKGDTNSKSVEGKGGDAHE